MYDPKLLSVDEFDAIMAGLGPFEASPHLAVAVSGGADSMALCLLAHDWAGARGGRITALTVDHGLRDGAQAEALQVGRWLNERGIEPRVLSWTGEKPTAGIQNAARSARYALLSQWCREANVLHLLLGHHEGDQAETVLMRHSRGSGVEGLAGMAAVVEMAAVRLVRPLLTVSPKRLRATLSSMDQPWIEDPSNSDPAYARNRVRAALPRLKDSGIVIPSLMSTRARMARARLALDAATWTVLARCCHLYPEGYAHLDASCMADVPGEVSTRALGWVLKVIGGRIHAPGVEKLERVCLKLIRENELDSATLGRCRLIRAGGDVLVCREARGLPSPQLAQSTASVIWDDRFLIDVVSEKGSRAGEVWLTALGASGIKQIAKNGDRAGRRASGRHAYRVPRPVITALPALADNDGVLSVPHLGFLRGGAGQLPVRIREVYFRPQHALLGSGHYLA